MKMRKLICMGMILAMSLSVLNGCGSEPEKMEKTEEKEESSKSDEKINLEFWDMTWGPAEYISTAEGLVQKFNDSQDEIEVTYQSIPWDNFYQTFTTAIASESAPDVSTGSGYQQHQFAVMDEILPLDSIIEEWEAEGKTEDMLEGSIEQFQWDGKQIGIPFNCDPRAIFYRKDVFEEKGIKIPETWEELVQAAIDATSEDMYGFTTGGADNLGYWAMANFIFGQGGRIFNESKEPTFNCQENVKAIRDIQTMVDNGVFPAGNASYTVEDAQKLFLQGKAAMIYAGADFGPIIENQTETEFIDDIGVLPMIPAENGECYAPGGMNAIMGYSQSEHPEECKTFIKWWSENSADLWTDGHMGAFSVRKSILNIDYFQNDIYKKLLADEIMPYFITTNQPIPHAFPEMASVEGELLLRDAFQMALSKSGSPEEIADQINDKLAAIMQAASEE